MIVKYKKALSGKYLSKIKGYSIPTTTKFCWSFRNNEGDFKSRSWKKSIEEGFGGFK